MTKIIDQILKDKKEGMTREQARKLYPNIKEEILDQIYSSEIQQNEKWAEFSNKIIETNNRIEQIEENIGGKVKEQLKEQLNEIISQVERGVKDIKEALPDIEALEKKIQKIETQIKIHEKKKHITEKDIQEKVSPLIFKQTKFIEQLGEIGIEQKDFQKEIQERISELPTIGDLHPEEHDLKSHIDVEITGKELNELPKKIEEIRKVAARKEVPRLLGGGITEKAAWGSITGTLTDQTDLQTALDARSLLNHSISQHTFDADVDLGANLLKATTIIELGNGFIAYNDAGFEFYSDAGITKTGEMIMIGTGIYRYLATLTPDQVYGVLDFSGLTPIDKTFTFPNASGTLALISNVLAYSIALG